MLPGMAYYECQGEEKMKGKDSSVNFRGSHPALLWAMFKADKIVRARLGYEMVITSCNDGRHSNTSRHYIGCAWDFRTWTTESSGIQIPMNEKKNLATELTEQIEGFRFLAEKDHIHASYKPLYSDLG